MRGHSLAIVVVLGTALLAAGVSSAGRPMVRPTLKGSCTALNRLDSNGVILSSTVVCKSTGSCNCGRKMQLVYTSTWRSPGTGAPGPERGTLTASARNLTVTLKLAGTKYGSGQSSGRWVLGKVSGAPRSSFRSRGTYTALDSTMGSDLGPTTAVRISTRIACWSC